MTNESDTTSLPDLTLTEIEAILLRQGYIASIWGIEDVQTLRPDLSEAQCLAVLQECRSQHDAEIGISFPILYEHASDLFPEPDSDDENEAVL